MDWISLSENVVLRLAAFSVAAGVVFRYVLRPFFNTVGRALRGYRALTAEVEEVRRLVSSQNSVVMTQLGNGGQSVPDKLTRVESDMADVKEDVSDLKGGQHDLSSMLTTWMALDDLRINHLIAQLNERGIFVKPLPSRKDREV